MAYTLLWDNSTNTNATYLGNYVNGKTYRGENFTGGTDIIGKRVNEVKVKLGNYGGAITGTCYVVIVKSDFTEIDIGSLDVSTLDSTLVEKTFTNATNDYTMQADDMVCIKYEPPFQTQTAVLMCEQSTNTFTNSDYAQKAIGSGGSATWTTDINEISAAMKIYGGSGSPTTDGVLLPPPIAVMRI